MNTTIELLLKHGLIATAVAFSWAAQAQGVYTCTTAEGRRITSDRPIPECFDREQRQLSTTSGRVEVIPPRETQAQRWAAEEARKEESRQRLRAEQQQRLDRQLLLRYPDDVALELRRGYLLDEVKKRWAPTLAEKTELDAERKELQKRAAARQKEGKPSDFEDAKAAVRLERRALQIRPMVDKMQAEIDEVNQQMDADLLRLRTLRAEQEAARAKARSGISPSKKP